MAFVFLWRGKRPYSAAVKELSSIISKFHDSLWHSNYCPSAIDILFIHLFIYLFAGLFCRLSWPPAAPRQFYVVTITTKLGNILKTNLKWLNTICSHCDPDMHELKAKKLCLYNILTMTEPGQCPPWRKREPQRRCHNGKGHPLSAESLPLAGHRRGLHMWSRVEWTGLCWTRYLGPKSFRLLIHWRSAGVMLH